MASPLGRNLRQEARRLNSEPEPTMSKHADSSNRSSSSSVKEDLRDHAHTLVGDVREFGSISKRAAEDTAEAAMHRARAVKEDASSKAHDVEDQIVKYIREQPLKSILVAAGVGAIASMWLRR